MRGRGVRRAEQEAKPLAARRIAASVLRLRRERGWQQQDLAAWIGVDRATVCRMEHRGTAGHLLREVAWAFGVPVRELLAACPVCKLSPPQGFRCQACCTDGPAPTIWRVHPRTGAGAEAGPPGREPAR